MANTNDCRINDNRENPKVNYSSLSIFFSYQDFRPVLASGVVEIVQNFSDYAKWITIKEFSLAPILSITSIPFFYLTMLYMQYESMFVRLQYSEAKRAGFIREAKCATIRYAKISYKKIRSIKGLKMAKLLRADSLSEFNKYLRMSASDSGTESETE